LTEPLVTLQHKLSELSERDPCPLPSPFAQLTPIIWGEKAREHGIVIMAVPSKASDLGTFISEVSSTHMLMGWILGRHQGEMISTFQRLWPEIEF